MLYRVTLTSLVLSFAISCAPPVDGGWQGNAVCNGDAFPVTAVFNEEGDGDLKGVVYIEEIFFGAGIVRGDIQGGQRDPDDGSYEFDLNTDGNDDREFAVDMSFDENDFDQLNGDVTIFNDNGEPTDECELDLERTSVSGD